jgi:drug/metabolite transporter (DMT)-like permease
MTDGRALTGAWLVVAACSIGTADVLIRAAYDRGSEPTSVLAIRLAVPAVLAAAVCLWLFARGRLVLRIGLRAGLAIVGFGLLEAVSQVGEIRSLVHMPAALVILVFALAPVWIGLAGWVFWREPIGRWGLAAIGAALGGTLLVVGVPSEDVSLVGVGYAVAGGITGAGALVIVERELREVPPALTLAAGTTFAATILLVADPGLFAEELVHGSGRASLVLLSGLGFAIAILLVLISIQRSNAFIAAVSVALEPVLAATVAWLALGETLAPNQVAGGMLAVLGLVVALGLPARPLRAETPS